jgi:hypothetical protein
MIKFVRDLRQVCGFLQLLRSPTQIKLISTIKYRRVMLVRKSSDWYYYSYSVYLTVSRVSVRTMVFYDTFNNMLVISWRSALFV